VKNFAFIFGFLSIIFVIIYRLAWGMGIKKRRSLVYYKRTILMIFAILAIAMAILLDTIASKIVYPLLIIGIPVLISGIPMRHEGQFWLENDRRDFREGRNIWEKIKIWIFY
jgi:uncharacterized membrane protein